MGISQLVKDKAPRHYAAEIAQLPTKEQRQVALTAVPPEWRELVKKHVEITFFVNKHRK